MHPLLAAGFINAVAADRRLVRRGPLGVAPPRRP
jgi:hypothetical protein